MALKTSASTEHLLKRTEQSFFERWADRPVYRFIAVPPHADEDVLDFSNGALKEYFLHPPATRSSGFTFWDVAEFVPSADEWIGKSVDEHVYVLTREGYFEFNYPLDGESIFQWLHHKYPSTPPWLYPLAVCELAVSCCRFVAGLVNRFRIPSQMLIKHEYFGIQGYWLPPRKPDMLWGREVAQTRYPKPNMPMKFRVFDFESREPDAIAWELVSYVYSSFGLTSEAIPYFDENHRFTI